MKKVSKKNTREKVIRFPKFLVEPVAKFLKEKLSTLEKRKKKIAEEDPFRVEDRVLDNASPDTDATEQFGHSINVAIREQIDKAIIQTKKALARIKIGKYGICEKCHQMIDTDRLMVFPEATLCTKCQKEKEKKEGS